MGSKFVLILNMNEVFAADEVTLPLGGPAAPIAPAGEPEGANRAVNRAPRLGSGRPLDSLAPRTRRAPASNFAKSCSGISATICSTSSAT
jgi:hypothetical protein